MKYLEGLNEAQKRAVLATRGPISVLAGAGAGKTRVLTTRIYHLVREGTPPERILAITFTNKAAREMRERVRTLLSHNLEAKTFAEEGLPRATASGMSKFSAENYTYPSKANVERTREPFIGTFHGLGRELLESYGTAIGVPRFFSIFDRDDSEKVVREALKRLDIDPKELSPRSILSRISKAKGEGMSLATFSEKFGNKSFPLRITALVWRDYATKLRDEKALDFDDLIALPVRLLTEHPEIRALAEDRWDYVHIDEYQDTNALQGQLANLLAAKTKNLFVVGDIDQTIYTWRGATIENLLEFEETYPGAETIVLEHNYRSTKTIVDAANSVIEQNKKRKEKRSVTDNPEGAPILLAVAPSGDEEARWIARKIRALLREGESLEETAVLFRTNFQSRALEEALLGEGIPYRLLGTRFFERKEVKDVLAWVRLALEPSRETDKIRAAQAPTRGIGKTTLAKLAAGKRGELRAGDLAKIERFEALVAELSKASETTIPSEFVRSVIEKSGMEKALEEGGEEDLERLENIRELATLASRHDAMPGKEGIAAFVAEAALASDQDELDRDETKRGVTLMTVHAAKGLEFDTVFVAGMEEGLFPHEGMGGEERDEEEERRLFYVAMTRAKKRLVLSLARIRRIYGSDFISEPSSFLNDIDTKHLSTTESDTEPTIEA